MLSPLDTPELSSSFSIQKELEQDIIGYITAKINYLIGFKFDKCRQLDNEELVKISDLLRGRHNNKNFVLDVRVTEENPMINIEKVQDLKQQNKKLKRQGKLGRLEVEKNVLFDNIDNPYASYDYLANDENRKRKIADIITDNEEEQFTPAIDNTIVRYQRRLLSKADYSNMLKVLHTCKYLTYKCLLKVFCTEGDDEKNGNGNAKQLRKGVSLQTLSDYYDITRWHFHRVFKSFTNITIKEYETLCLNLIQKNPHNFRIFKDVVSCALLFDKKSLLKIGGEYRISDTFYWDEIDVFKYISDINDRNDDANQYKIMPGYFIEQQALGITSNSSSYLFDTTTSYEKQVETRSRRRNLLYSKTKLASIKHDLPNKLKTVVNNTNFELFKAESREELDNPTLNIHQTEEINSARNKIKNKKRKSNSPEYNYDNSTPFVSLGANTEIPTTFNSTVTTPTTADSAITDSDSISLSLDSSFKFMCNSYSFQVIDQMMYDDDYYNFQKNSQLKELEQLQQNLDVSQGFNIASGSGTSSSSSSSGTSNNSSILDYGSRSNTNCLIFSSSSPFIPQSNNTKAVEEELNAVSMNNEDILKQISVSCNANSLDDISSPLNASNNSNEDDNNDIITYSQDVNYKYNHHNDSNYNNVIGLNISGESANNDSNENIDNQLIFNDLDIMSFGNFADEKMF
ncbi:uncharacterized protein SCDLUD_004356 [Saccharomycodes ludwigii]|uniref:uncharacterized protein n=1 Tax=Saccharomycodes ludwigii TaxID=36035 RepID=UPI001E85E679|nr:hypothetical protein SCDLUD_004356 [Saccharomycodes ludwigii]KAH3900039.1 hypothetical protein SCDLUD_004356 [Saccharomycodes ludwigii]